MTDDAPRQPLAGVTVLDFTTLLPGPLATLLLAEAGATVIKVERPDVGDELRIYPPPRWTESGDTAAFALLNRGKRSIAIDLKDEGERARLTPLLERADVLVEQFRPGVMARLGLDYETLAGANPKLVYCAVTGWGQSGPMKDHAGHDLNYIAETGLLALGGAGADGAPLPPPGLIADIGGGALPAVVNILLALREAERTGRGRYLDVAMVDGVMSWQWWAQAAAQITGRAPAGGGALLTGGSPRYRVYRTADDRFLAVAPLEQRFWDAFCQAIDLPEALRDDAHDPAATAAAVAEILGRRSAAAWEERFRGLDVCVTAVKSVADAPAHPHFRARGLFEREVRAGRDADAPAMTALPTPIDASFKPADKSAAAPRLGEDTDALAPRRD
ncbi:MAG: CoA transferase [Marivibrio sp.]|uniref:CaiB/BaiF CoA transferase family protein n=1 Tax=Marivibrio sp. TaxID=2039719 RepID=UPI0032EF18CD